MNRKQKRMLYRILLSAGLFVAAILIPADGVLQMLLFGIPYVVIGWDVLWTAFRHILNGQLFDENFLMAIASLGAFCTGEAMEGVAVMLFYQVGELFQKCAVSKSRRSIAALMDISPEYANLEENGETRVTDPASVAVGSIIVSKPGEKIPLDGVVLTGDSVLDTAALTGESVPRGVHVGDSVISGCINLQGVLRIRTTKTYENSTVSKILSLIEESSEKKASAENFITKFARWYTPCVVIAAAFLAVIPPLFFGGWTEWIHRALTFLVVSCPCALVISVPLTFFGGIGGASRAGILVKGGNYLEVLAKADTVVMDKTGTLTEGVFRVSEVQPIGMESAKLLEIAAHAEMYSDHPIARSILEAYGKQPDAARVQQMEEIVGCGVRTELDGETITVGNERWMRENGIDCTACPPYGTAVHVTQARKYCGYILIADSLKKDAAAAVAALKRAGIRRTVMLTGDRKAVGEAVAAQLGIDQTYTDLLPEDKVAMVESLLGKSTGSLVFVGDGMNDAPVLTRADVGIAMGAMGSDAAIEAADVVLMDDHPSKVSLAIRIARRTMRIVRQNIVFALGVKGVILLLSAFGYANMWAAVFADVGVAVIAILNATRALRIPK